MHGEARRLVPLGLPQLTTTGRFDPRLMAPVRVRRASSAMWSANIIGIVKAAADSTPFDLAVESRLVGRRFFP
ncbi:MAG: hypothetical protein JWO98_4319 [Frankiales bacterium]|nr:hypothetical protein [Frankiales bacterium]